jgi:hypothetical protein
MKYVALFTGKGTGCDYTIDCNKKFEVFEAENHEKALMFCRQVWSDHGGSQGQIEQIDLYVVSESVAVPVKEWDAEDDEENLEDTQEELRQVEARAKELRERLANGR